MKDNKASVRAWARERLRAAMEPWPSVRDSVELAPAVVRALEACDVSAQPVGLQWDDLGLAAACIAGDAGALEQLNSRCVDSVVPALASRGAERREIDELCHEVRIHLLVAEAGKAPRLAAYSGRGPLRAFVRTTAIRLWLDRKRRTRRTDPGDLAESLSATSDPELEHMKSLYVDEFRKAVTSAWSALEAEHRLFLQHRLQDGFTIDDLARLYGYHRSSVARRLAAARDELLGSTKRHLRAQLGIADSDITTLLRIIDTRLDLVAAAIGG